MEQTQYNQLFSFIWNIATDVLVYAFEKGEYSFELEKLKKAAKHAQNLGLKVNAGHGLNYENVYLMKEIEGLCELNIGHSIISRAVFDGLSSSIQEMLNLIK